VLEVSSAIGKTRVEFGDAAAGSLAMLRPLVLTSVTPLQPGQPLFLFSEEPLVARLFARRARDHISETQVNTNGGGNRWQGINLGFDEQRHKIAACRIT
jgi:hypothetical protein